jgi:hypothetical protein
LSTGEQPKNVLPISVATWNFLFISKNCHLTERSFDRMFFFLKNCRFRKKNLLTDCSYSIRIVHVPNFFITNRRRKRKNFFLYCHYYYSSRVENMIKVTDCDELRHSAWRRRRHRGNQTLFWSDADLKMRKAFPILMMNQGCLTFCQKLFRSNDHFSKKAFGQMTIFRKKHSVK